jgi:hypothetical protein
MPGSRHHGTKDDRYDRPRRENLSKQPHVDIVNPEATAGNDPKGSNFAPKEN